MKLVMKQDKFLRHFKTDDYTKLRATRYYSINQPSRPVYSRGAPLRSPSLGLHCLRSPCLRSTWGRGGVVILLASLCISLILFLFPAHASALTKKSPVVLPTLQLTVGFEDDSRVDYWTPVQIALSNEGPNFSGFVSVTTYSGFARQVAVGNTLPWSYQASVVLPHGTQKQINLDIPFYETPTVPHGIVATLSDNNGKVITTQTASPYVLHSGSLLIGILSDHAAESPEFSSLSKVSLPDPERVYRIGNFERQHNARCG